MCICQCQCRGCSCDVWTKWAKWSERRIWGQEQLRICDSKSFVALRGTVTCRFTHGEADFVRELAIQSSWQLGDRSFMSRVLKAHTKITVPATTLTNQQILASAWSVSASRPMVKRLSLLRVIWCRENIKGGTGKNNKAKIQYNDWILDLL